MIINPIKAFLRNNKNLVLVLSTFLIISFILFTNYGAPYNPSKQVFNVPYKGLNLTINSTTQIAFPTSVSFIGSLISNPPILLDYINTIFYADFFWFFIIAAAVFGIYILNFFVSKCKKARDTPKFWNLTILAFKILFSVLSLEVLFLGAGWHAIVFSSINLVNIGNQTIEQQLYCPHACSYYTFLPYLQFDNQGFSLILLFVLIVSFAKEIREKITSNKKYLAIILIAIIFLLLLTISNALRDSKFGSYIFVFTPFSYLFGFLFLTLLVIVITTIKPIKKILEHKYKSKFVSLLLLSPMLILLLFYYGVSTRFYNMYLITDPSFYIAPASQVIALYVVFYYLEKKAVRPIARKRTLLKL